MSTLSRILLLQSSKILNKYSGIMGGIRNYGYTRRFVPQVSQLVSDIYDQKITLQEFSDRLSNLEKQATEREFPEHLDDLEEQATDGDILGWYIQEVRKSIALTLQDMPEYLFPQENSYKFNYFADLYHIYASSENSHAFIIAFDMLQTKTQKTVAIDRMINLNFGLHRLITDEPVRAISALWEQYHDDAIQFFYNNASTTPSVNALLDLFASLPLEANKTLWLTTVGNQSGQNLLSLTMAFAPQRYAEVLGCLEGLDNAADKAKILLYSVCLSRSHKIINPVLSACIHYPAALPALLAASTALPNKAEVDQFFKNCLNLVCQNPQGWVEKHFNNTLIPRAENMFSAILAMSDKKFVFDILTMHVSEHPWNNMVRYIIQYSPKMFVQMMVTALSFDDVQRTQLLQIIFKEAMQSAEQSKILINFLLSTPDLPNDFLQITAPGSNWNILHIVARYCPSQVPKMLALVDEKIPYYNENLLSGLTDEGYTPLMMAAKHGAAAVPYFLDSITLLPNCSSILKRVGDDNSSALTLVSNSGNNLTGNLINDAIEGRYKNIAIAGKNPLFFQPCGSTLVGTAVTPKLLDLPEVPSLMMN